MRQAMSAADLRVRLARHELQLGFPFRYRTIGENGEMTTELADGDAGTKRPAYCNAAPRRQKTDAAQSLGSFP